MQALLWQWKCFSSSSFFSPIPTPFLFILLSPSLSSYTFHKLRIAKALFFPNRKLSWSRFYDLWLSTVFSLELFELDRISLCQRINTDVVHTQSNVLSQWQVVKPRLTSMISNKRFHQLGIGLKTLSLPWATLWMFNVFNMSKNNRKLSLKVQRVKETCSITYLKWHEWEGHVFCELGCQISSVFQT